MTDNEEPKIFLMGEEGDNPQDSKAHGAGGGAKIRYSRSGLNRLSYFKPYIIYGYFIVCGVIDKYVWLKLKQSNQ